MIERNEAALKIFVSHQQVAKAVEQTVADLNNPAPRLLGQVEPSVIGLLIAINDMSNVAVRIDDQQGRPPAISCIRGQVPAASDPARHDATIAALRVNWRTH